MSELMINIQYLNNKRILRMIEFFQACETALINRPVAARFFHDLVTGLESELQARSLFGIHTQGEQRIQISNVADLSWNELVGISDFMMECSTGFEKANPIISNLYMNIVEFLYESY